MTKSKEAVLEAFSAHQGDIDMVRLALKDAGYLSIHGSLEALCRIETTLQSLSKPDNAALAKAVEALEKISKRKVWPHAAMSDYDVGFDKANIGCAAIADHALEALRAPVQEDETKSLDIEQLRRDVSKKIAETRESDKEYYRDKYVDYEHGAMWAIEHLWQKGHLKSLQGEAVVPDSRLMEIIKGMQEMEHEGFETQTVRESQLFDIGRAVGWNDAMRELNDRIAAPTHGEKE